MRAPLAHASGVSSRAVAGARHAEAYPRRGPDHTAAGPEDMRHHMCMSDDGRAQLRRHRLPHRGHIHAIHPRDRLRHRPNAHHVHHNTSHQQR